MLEVRTNLICYINTLAIIGTHLSPCHLYWNLNWKNNTAWHKTGCDNRLTGLSDLESCQMSAHQISTSAVSLSILVFWIVIKLIEYIGKFQNVLVLSTLRNIPIRQQQNTRQKHCGFYDVLISSLFLGPNNSLFYPKYALLLSSKQFWL